ncbi:hypothetical protein JNW89_25215 [Micromonospora sp. 4G55]|nr:hypothetical protein [Micromonospora sp. 4G55]MBM0259519.1 hypothetical protein [Micromonospora sp. 4G55]
MPRPSQRRTRGRRGKSARFRLPVAVAGRITIRSPSTRSTCTSVPGVAFCSRVSSVSSTQDPLAKPALPSRPGTFTVSTSTSMLSQVATVEPLSRDHT